MITQEELKEVLAYNPDTGEWVWVKMLSANAPIMSHAGRVSRGGRIQIRIYGKNYYAARLAFLYMTGEWPAEYVDHINGDPTDDRWENLREASKSQNSMNAKGWGSSGIKGVYRRTDNSWLYAVTVQGVGHKGYCSTFEEAAAAVQELRTQLHGEYARN